MPRAFFADLPPLRLPSGPTVHVSVVREPGDTCRVVVATGGRHPGMVLDMAWADLQAICGQAGRAINQQGQQHRQRQAAATAS